jgi:hypothetical protein
MKGIRMLSLTLLTTVLCFWISLIASQQNFVLILLVFFGALFAAREAARRRSTALRGWKCWATGAVTGYVAMVLAIAVCELVLRGASFFERSFVPNLYFFPSLSLGWLYGGTLFGLTVPSKDATRG